MSISPLNCNITTQTIQPTECIGSSLGKINTNFSTLNSTASAHCVKINELVDGSVSNLTILPASRINAKNTLNKTGNTLTFRPGYHLIPVLASGGGFNPTWDIPSNDPAPGPHSTIPLSGAPGQWVNTSLGFSMDWNTGVFTSPDVRDYVVFHQVYIQNPGTPNLDEEFIIDQRIENMNISAGVSHTSTRLKWRNDVMTTGVASVGGEFMIAHGVNHASTGIGGRILTRVQQITKLASTPYKIFGYGLHIYTWPSGTLA